MRADGGLGNRSTSGSEVGAVETEVRIPGRRCIAWLRAASLYMMIAVVMALAACGSSGDSSPAPTPGATVTSFSTRPSSPASATPASVAEAARQDAVAAYLGMWKADAQASHTADWRASYLSRYASGEALQVLTGGLYADHANGLVAQGEPVNNPTVTSVSPTNSPTSVMVSDCSDSRNWLRHKADGSPFTDTPGGSRRIIAEVRKHTDGLWRVTQFGVAAVGSC